MNCFYPLRFRYLLMVVALLFAPALRGQSPFYEQLIPLTSGIGFTNVVQSGRFGPDIVIVDAGMIVKMDAVTGEVHLCKKLMRYNSDITVSAATQVGGVLYITGTTADSVGRSGFLMKYSLAEDKPILMSTVAVNGFKQQSTAIGADSAGNIYVAGPLNDAAHPDQIVVIKADSSLAISWARSISMPTHEFAVNAVVVAADNNVYLSIEAYNSFIGMPLLLRFDTAGHLRRTRALLTVGNSPRFGSTFGAVVNGSPVFLMQSILGPSDTGPNLVLKLDSNLSTVASTAFWGLMPLGISANRGQLLVLGQAPVTFGLMGFRSVRLRSDLSIAAAGYFNELPTSSYSTIGNCYLGSDGIAYHFFNTTGVDPVFVARTDTSERIYCADTLFRPSATTISTYDTAVRVTDTIANAIATGAIAYVYTLSMLAHQQCYPSAVPTDGEDAPSDWFLSPNPATDYISINKVVGNLRSVQITDVLGKTQLAASSAGPLNVASLPNGLYLVQIETAYGTSWRRFVKQ